MITVIAIILAGICNAFMDKLKVWHDSKWINLSKEHWFYKWGNPNVSWKNKYQLLDGYIIKDGRRKWYYLWLMKPDYKEKYPFSTTLLVFLTDAWHSFQMAWLCLMVLAIVSYRPIWGDAFIDYGFLMMMYLIPFNYFYDKLLDKKL